MKPLLPKLAPRNSFGAIYQHLKRHRCIVSTGPEAHLFFFALPLFLLWDLLGILHMMWTADLAQEESEWQGYYADLRSEPPGKHRATVAAIREDFNSSGMP